MKSFYKLFLLALAIVCTAISFTKADTIINWFTFATPTNVIETLPEELPKTWAEEWNGDCKSYHPSSYWKESVCYTPKWAWTFDKTITTTTDTKHVCLLDDNRLDNLIYVLKDLQKEYSKKDVMCLDIVSLEKSIKLLVDELFVSRNKTTTNSTAKETPKRIPFPAPTVKYITRTVSVKVCNMWVYDKALDTCILMVTWAR